MTNPDDSSSPTNGARRRLLLRLAAVFTLAALAYGLWWWFAGRFHEYTDDAYVAGHVVQITPQTAGTVVAVAVEDTDFVKAGQLLVRYDPADARVALVQAEAELARTVRQVRTLYTGEAAAAALVKQRQADLAKARSDLARRRSLVGTGAVAGEEIDHARDAVSAAEAALAVAQEQRRGSHAQVAGTRVAEHPDVARAAARVEEAYLAWARSVMLAPVDGYVAKRSVQVGQRVASGTPIMAVVPLDKVWVDANFKEAQLEHMRVGQPVSLNADVYGGDVTYHGKVAGFSPGTGAAFALLPAQNATGNWIKVVQRLPVRLELDAKELAAHPLQVGLSMKATVDTHERTGSRLGTPPQRAASASNTIFERQDQAAKARVQALVDASLANRPAPALPADPLAASHS